MSATPDRERLKQIGVWAPAFRLGDPSEAGEAAAELERLGYGAAWVPGVAMPGVVASLEPLLAATGELMVNTGVVNIWVEDPAQVAAEHARLADSHPGRMLIGLGISHAPLIGDRYVRPLSAMREFLDALDAADPPLGAEQRLLGAIGPKTLELARERSRGSHPYLMPPQHTAIAREALGDEPLLCPEQTVVLETDPERARAVARKWLSAYIELPNYMDNLRRVLDLTDEDFADGGSDRLVDAAVVWGDEQAIAERVREHLAAGADHVCIQVVARAKEFPVEAWTRLAGVLID